MKWEFLQDPFDTQYERKEVPPIYFPKTKELKVRKKKRGSILILCFMARLKSRMFLVSAQALKLLTKIGAKKKRKRFPFYG